MARQAGEDESSTGILFDALMREARERVAGDFLAACEGDEAKRTVVLELCQKVLSDDQYSTLILAERSEEEDEENTEDDSETDEQNDDGHDENDESHEGSSDDDGIPTMTVIKGKPYKDGVSAETGELPFEEFKDLFDPDENQPEQSSRRKPSLEPNKDAKRLFGEENAKKLVNWHHHVKNSGQLYSEEWLEGKIRDQNLEKIEKPMLLICLQDNKISKAPTAVLGKICRGLELQPIVKKALEVWGVADKFHKVWARKPTDQYTARDIKPCRQCEIFVARAYVCISTLKHAEVSDDLGNKLLSCFVEMEKNLPQELARKRARKQSTDSGTQGTAASPFKAEAKPKASNTAENTSTAPIGNSGDGKVIEQVCQDTGKVLNTFKSTRDIVNRLGVSMNAKNISKALKGKQKTAYDYVWRYKEASTSATMTPKAKGKPEMKERSEDNIRDSSKDEQIDIQNVAPNQRLDKSPTRKEKVASSKDKAKNKITATNTNNADASDDTEDGDIIEQVSPDTGEVLGEFSNLRDIYDRIGHSMNSTNPRNGVSRVLRGEQKHACGCSWRYKKKSTSAGNKSNKKGKPKETKGDNDAGNSRTASPRKILDKTVTTQRQKSEKSATSKEATKDIPPSPKPSNQSPHAEADDKRIIEQVFPTTGEVLGEFSSIEDIVTRIGHSLKNKHPKKYIRSVLRGSQKHFNGFIWRYKGLPTDQILHTTSEDHRKREALDGMLDPPASKRTKPSEGETGDYSQSRNPGIQTIQAIHPSSGGLQHLSGAASSRALKVRAIASMPEIRESPYMKEQSAEVGEEMFDSFKDLLIPRGADGRNLEASQRAKDVFGETLARQMVTASTFIAKSGMIYGNTWKDGLIQGKKCGLLSKPMLLLCLQEQRLASSSPEFLKIIIGDLGVVTIVDEVIKAWELGTDFPLLVGMKNISALQSRTKALLGSMIFVARSYRCMVALKRKKASDSILKKVRKCLSIVHDSLEQQGERKKRPREVTQGKVIAAGHRSNSVEPVVQKKKAGSSHPEHTTGVSLGRVDEGMRSDEPFNPGIIKHNLFLKRANVTSKLPKEKPKPSTKPQKATKLSTPSLPVTAGKSIIQEDNGMEQARTKKQTTTEPAHILLQTKQLTQAQPTNRLLQPGQQTSIRPVQDSRQQAKQQTPKPAPGNSEETNKSQPREAHNEPTTRASTSPDQPMNAPRPLQSDSSVPMPPITSIVQPAGPWYPPDQAGLLNDAETELAWLTTECSFALRLPPNTISWPFVFEYSSPLLKMELREVETNLERLVRLNDGFVRDRFKVLRGEIQKELNNGKRRPLMEKIIPLLRLRSRLANRGRKP